MDGPVVKVVHVPQVQVVEKTIEIPQLQTVEKIVDIPEVQTLEAGLHEIDDEERCCDDLEEICYVARMSRKRKESVETGLHEIGEDLCRVDFEEICYVARMSRKHLWRRVWHDCSSPSDASKSARSWRRLSKCLCYEEEFDEMKRTCAYCGRFEDEDDILVRCQGPNCSLRSVEYELPGLFHGRCAAAFGYSGSAHWQNCPWCPPAKHAENFDKPDGLSAAIDEHFEKFDEKHESDEYVCGKWVSEKG